MTQPFFKYAGGKRRLASVILPLLQLNMTGRYVEPFVGGGAIFLTARGEGFKASALLNDGAPMISGVWRAVQTDPGGTIASFNAHAKVDCPQHYYEVRQQPPPSAIERAGWFLYINKAGFNGLWRVNRKGLCNVPYGDGRPPTLNEDALHAASRALVGTDIQCGDFASIELRPGDSVYCDPPYLPLSTTAHFTSYTRGGFAAGDQLRLAAWARRGANIGARIVVSNAGTADSITAFGSTATEVIELGEVRRSISCKGSERKSVCEYLFIYK